jgi:hypothetical protein
MWQDKICHLLNNFVGFLSLLRSFDVEKKHRLVLLMLLCASSSSSSSRQVNSADEEEKEKNQILTNIATSLDARARRTRPVSQLSKRPFRLSFSSFRSL